MADGSFEGSIPAPRTAVRAPPARGFFDRLAVQGRVVRALMLREMMTRFGRQNLGFFWLMGEPLILSVLVMIGWTIAKGEHDHNIGVIPFVLTGYAVITMWRHIIGRSANCLSHNAGLMFHRNVHVADTLLARGLLEIGGCALSFVIAYVPLYLFDLVPLIDDPLTLVLGWVLTGWFCLSFAICIAALSERYEIAERFVQPLMYVTLPVTGTFYMVDWMPPSVQWWLLWSPMVHGNEMFRAGLFGPQVTTYFDPLYLAACNLVLTTLGLAMVRWVRKYVRLEK